MSADIHAVALVADGTRDTTDIRTLFEDDGLDGAALQEFKSSCEASWPRAYDEGLPFVVLLLHGIDSLR